MSKRKIYICFLLIMQLYTCCYAQDDLDENRYILWGENMELSWDDFLLEYKPKKAVASASASIGLGIYFSLKEKDKNTIIFNIYAYMNKEKSWSEYHGVAVADADSWQSNYGLRHERTHFDIDEVYARECRMLLSKIKANSFEKVKNKYDKIRQEIEVKRQKEQTLYDEETNHSINIEKQAEWNKKIAERLKELEAYKDTVVTIRIKKK